MQVLVHLAENPGVVNRDQLIAAVWPDVFVSDDVLPGCVSALRKAFNDNARHPQIIGTIHKGGYRLLLPIEWTNGHQAAKSMQPVPAPLESVPRFSRRSAITVLSLLVMFCLAFIAWISSRPRYDSIAVLPFVNAANDPDSAYLSDGIAEGVINGLSEIQALKVMAWTTVSRYRNPKADVRSLGRDLGVKSVLTGRLLCACINATTLEESIPPDKKAPSGTSAIIRNLTAWRKRVSSCSIASPSLSAVTSQFSC